jgi:hypothetical protein
MTLTHKTPVFSIDEAAIYPMLTDVALSAPTYSAKVSIPGIHTVTPAFDILSKELFGDNVVLGQATKVRKATLAATFAKLSLDVLAILSGGTTTDAGTTPNQTSTFGIGRTATPGYFKFECRVLGVELPGPAGGGSFNIKLNKCKASNFAPVVASEDYGAQTMDLVAIYPEGTANLIDLIFNETAAALSS